MLDSIGTSRDGMVDEVLDNINAELSNRGTFGGFGVERRQLLICRNVDTVEYVLKDSRKVVGQFKDCSD